ncbi:MAG: tyrosine-type recombinase/integrase [Saprospiraceae bacterium]|nr:tyrosine-type recombinase/integrase [Candidatus Defluviibacterium haderslevense]
MNSKESFELTRNKLLEDYRSFMVLKNFSPRTIKTYVSILDYFFRYCELHFPNEVMNDDLVRKYLLHRFDAGCCWQTVNSDYSAIQKFYKNVVFLEWSLKKLPRPRKEKPLPTIFSKEDIVKIIESATTFKQQILLTFIYVTGARLSEAVFLKIDDIDGSRCQIRINGGKGAKDRLILVPAQFIQTLREYYKKIKPEIYLFNGATKGVPYAPRTLQYTLQQAKRLARITKKGSIHTLRNCYATHHLESGTDLVFLQEQMGHKNLRTTIRYIGLCVERQRYINHPIESMQIQYRK